MFLIFFQLWYGDALRIPSSHATRGHNKLSAAEPISARRNPNSPRNYYSRGGSVGHFQYNYYNNLSPEIKYYPVSTSTVTGKLAKYLPCIPARYYNY